MVWFNIALELLNHQDFLGRGFICHILVHVANREAIRFFILPAMVCLLDVGYANLRGCWMGIGRLRLFGGMGEF